MNNDTPPDARSDVHTLGELIEDIEVAMLVSRAANGNLVSRPLATLKADEAGNLWFFTSAASGKVDDIARDPHVNLSYAHPGKHLYVSVVGVASVLRDRARIDELWSPAMRTFFPAGKNDPDLMLLKVEVESAEYWRSASGLVHQALQLMHAMTGDGPQDLGENHTINVRGLAG